MEYLGQHFLKNPRVTDKTLEALDPRAGECVIEIGPGKGALTKPLLALCQSRGCSYVGIEKDADLAPTLTPLFKDSQARVIVGDALRELPQLVATCEQAGTPYRIVGNIPYYITGFLLRTISELSFKPLSVVLLIQKEVADRICAPRGATNLLSASVQIWAEAHQICTVPPEDFDPPPRVTSAVIRLLTHQLPPDFDLADYYAIARICFKQPRKTLVNNLAEYGFGKKEILGALELCGLSSRARPQNLSTHTIISLARSFPAASHDKSRDIL